MIFISEKNNETTKFNIMKNSAEQITKRKSLTSRESDLN